jgi:hypothetical protein
MCRLPGVCVERSWKSYNFPHRDYCVAVEGGGGGGGGGRVRCTSTESGSPSLVTHWLRKGIGQLYVQCN